MAYLSLTLVADVYREVLETTPAPDYSPLLEMLGGAPRFSYRDRLDRQPVNYRGVPIPRIAIVRQHLADLKRGNIRVWRGLHVPDRRQRGNRRSA